MLSAELEDWLGNYVPTDHYNSSIMLTNRKGKMARRYARHTDLGQLLAKTPSLTALIKRLEASPKSQVNSQLFRRSSAPEHDTV